MTIYDDLLACKQFNVNGALVALWAFKKSTPTSFSARAIAITEELSNQLKLIVRNALDQRTEVDDYSLLAETNQVSCLHLGTDETIFENLKQLIDRPPEENFVQNTKQIDNSVGYVIRLRVDQDVLYCIKKTSNDWKTRNARNIINAVLVGNQLTLVEDRSLSISKNVDFFVRANATLVINKGPFETILNHKATYANSFADLQQQPTFQQLFSDMTPLVAHVGTNTMHLRRMAAIQQKGFYTDPAFMQRLAVVNDQEGWNIQFDASGRIVATADTIRSIMQILLDHRLKSQLSLVTYDVPSTSQVN